MPNELKPCPFCGGKAKVIKIPDGLSWAGYYVVGCDDNSMCMGNINHFTMVFFTPETAIEAWNRRVTTSEYIEREALIEKISSISVTVMGVRSGKTLFYEALKSYREAVLKNIKEAPTADVVKVVRCKDCKHYGANIKYRPPYYNFAFCYKFHHNITTDNDFCSYGERKGD